MAHNVRVTAVECCVENVQNGSLVPGRCENIPAVCDLEWKDGEEKVASSAMREVMREIVHVQSRQKTGCTGRVKNVKFLLSIDDIQFDYMRRALVGGRKLSRTCILLFLNNNTEVVDHIKM